MATIVTFNVFRETDMSSRFLFSTPIERDAIDFMKHDANHAEDIGYGINYFIEQQSYSSGSKRLTKKRIWESMKTDLGYIATR